MLSLDTYYSSSQFKGTSGTNIGREGYVPQAQIGESGNYLRGDGKWIDFGLSNLTSSYTTLCSNSGFWEKAIYNAYGTTNQIVVTNAGTNNHDNQVTLSLAQSAVFPGDVLIPGTLTVTGTATYINTKNLIVDDPIIFLANNNPGNLVDTGFASHFKLGPPLNNTHTGLVRRANQGVPGYWTLFSGLTTEPLTSVNIDWADPNIKLDTLSANIATNNGTSDQWNSVYTTVNSNSGNYILDGGNTKTANIVIGTNDAYNLNFETNNTNRISISSSGQVTIGNALLKEEALNVRGRIYGEGNEYSSYGLNIYYNNPPYTNPNIGDGIFLGWGLSAGIGLNFSLGTRSYNYGNGFIFGASVLNAGEYNFVLGASNQCGGNNSFMQGAGNLAPANNITIGEYNIQGKEFTALEYDSTTKTLSFDSSTFSEIDSIVSSYQKIGIERWNNVSGPPAVLRRVVSKDNSLYILTIEELQIEVGQIQTGVPVKVYIPTLNYNDYLTFISGKNNVVDSGGVAIGNNNVVGPFGIALGSNNFALGNSSHAEGGYTQALGAYSHAEGQSTIASGSASHTEGIGSVASGIGSHAEGIKTYALGSANHVEGTGASTDINFLNRDTPPQVSIGFMNHIEGFSNIAGYKIYFDSYDYIRKEFTFSSLIYNFEDLQVGDILVGYITDNSSIYKQFNILVEGFDTNISLKSLTATNDSIGFNVTSPGSGYLVFKNNNGADVYVNHIEGGFNEVSNGGVHHVEGAYNRAFGQGGTHVEGAYNTVYGFLAHVEGSNNVGAGITSHTAGLCACAAHDRSYIWHGGTTATVPVSTTKTDQFVVSADNGIFFPGKVGIGTDANDQALTVKGTLSATVLDINQLTAISSVPVAGTRTLTSLFLSITVGTSSLYIPLYK